MSEASCKTCKVKIPWSRGADITNEGYRCLSCSTLFYRQQNKRYREALEYYANKDNYEVNKRGIIPVIVVGEDKAIEALEGEE